MKQVRDVELGAGTGFDEFFRSEVEGQVRRATLLLGSPDTANDVVQEAFTQIYSRWALVSEPGPYLNRVVLNGCRDHWRRRDAERRVLPRLVDREASDPQVDPLGDILASLPFNQRAAVVLRYWGGLSTRQIAEELDCAPGSVGPWIDRALKKMRKVLA